MVVVLNGAIEFALLRNGVNPVDVIIDDLVTGVAVGALVFVYEWQRARQIRERLRMIAELNHHVRNSLQAILYNSYLHGGSQPEFGAIQESVRRIEWALEEVLPGATEPPKKPPEAAA